MPISSFYLFCFYNHLLLFTAYTFHTDDEHICHLIHQIFFARYLPLDSICSYLLGMDNVHGVDNA